MFCPSTYPSSRSPSRSSFLNDSASAVRLPELATELVRLKVDVIVAYYVAPSLAAKQATRDILLVAGPIGIEIQPVVMVRGPEEFESAFETFVRERDATVVQGSLGIKSVADLAIKYRLPTASTSRGFADTGGLMSFGPNEPAAFRYSAKFVQSILQGTHPKDLPIEQSTKFELVINLKTAKAIGLTIPEAFLWRADAVLE